MEPTTVAKSEPVLIDVDAPESWPVELLSFLDAHHHLFLDWETGPETVDAKAYDEAVYALSDALVPYAIRGWHCTRLTNEEIAHIIAEGLQLPDASMLCRRIDALIKADVLEPQIADALKARNQAHESNRAGMVWFCFFAPRMVGESGIQRFFRHWGGEALYNSHERDPTISPRLRAIGTPCLVEADVPIASLERHGGLDCKIVRRFLAYHGFHTTDPLLHVDGIMRPLAASSICRIIRFPEADFLTLTDCSDWDLPLVQNERAI